MKSFNGNAGNVKLKGKKSKVLQCGCCLAQDFRLRELIRGKQNEIDIFNKKGNDMEEKQDNTVSVYKISNLLKDLPSLYCNDFFNLIFNGDIYFCYGLSSVGIDIPLEKLFNKALGYMPEHITPNLSLRASVEVVDEQGGEDKGSYYRTVFKFEYPDNTTEYVDIEGYHSSYSGIDYYNHQPVLVEPKYKTIQVWE